MPTNNATLLWSKMQPEPGGDDIGNALRCEIRDGLWLLARQWQLGEFRAEDAGTMATEKHDPFLLSLTDGKK